MRHAIQILRDIADERSLQAAEAGDTDAADAWENIGVVLLDADQAVARDWTIVRERQGFDVEREVLMEAAQKLAAPTLGREGT